MNAHVDPQARLRNILKSALDGARYESWRRDGDRALILELKRADGRPVTLRFLGVQDSEISGEAEKGAVLRLKSVASPASLLTLFTPRMFRTPSHAARVRIEAGAARLEIVCEDVEWWEDSRPTI